jgi:hypothetical protein
MPANLKFGGERKCCSFCFEPLPSQISHPVYGGVVAVSGVLLAACEACAARWPVEKVLQQKAYKRLTSLQRGRLGREGRLIADQAYHQVQANREKE